MKAPRWLVNWRRRNPYRYGYDKDKSAWDASSTGTDLLGVMITQDKRRTPRRGVPLP